MSLLCSEQAFAHGGFAQSGFINPGAVVFDEGIVPNIVVDRAGGTLPYGQAANKTIQAASISNLNLGLVVTNLNSYGLVVADAFSPDHQIGHAWLPMKFDSKATSKDLVEAFNDKILPLLDEWYYDDANGKEALLALFDQAAADGATLVVATHELSFVNRVGRIVALRDGHLIHDGPPADTDIDALVRSDAVG